MNVNSPNLNRTPLRNSSLANKPFRSPFGNNNCTPLKSQNLKRQHSTPVISSPETASNNVELNDDENLIKRRKLNVKTCESTDNLYPSKNDLFAIKQRIRNKRLEINSLKIKLAYQKKHNSDDLNGEINKWEIAFKKAIIQYQKDYNERFIEGNPLDIKQILITLAIPESILELINDIDDIC